MQVYLQFSEPQPNLKACKASIKVVQGERKCKFTCNFDFGPFDFYLRASNFVSRLYIVTSSVSHF